MTLFKNGQIAADDWTFPGDDAELPASGKIAISRARLIAERESLRGRNAPLGLVLQSGENLDGIEDDIARLSLVVLNIPKYADGRLYSVARLLRERHGFAGEIRAKGDVLRDQISHLHRVGVDAFDVSHDGTAAALQSGSIVAPLRHMQAAAREQEETRVAGRPWLRVSPPNSIPGAGE